jgi:hypothetical protein
LQSNPRPRDTNSNRLEPKNWEVAKQVLKGFLWPADWEKCGAYLWDEVEQDRAAIFQLPIEQDNFDKLDALRPAK